MKALVFSGGGAKGSYQIGVWKALRKLNMKFDIVTGVSIGSINGAFYAMNKYHLAKNMWLHLKTSDFFDLDIGKEIKTEDIPKIIAKIIKDGGMSFDKAEVILRKTINEDALRRSKINYGLITVSLTTKKERSLTKEQIPVGKLIDYIVASSTCFPIVSKKNIDGEDFIDGGFYDGLPLNLAIEMGATEIVAVDLSVLSQKQSVKNKDIKIDTIKFNDKTKFTLSFSREQSLKYINIGYHDTMKYYNKLDGNIYTFKKNDLQKNYNKIQKYFIDIIKSVLLEQEQKRVLIELFNITKFNRLFNYIKTNQSINKEINEAIEYLGDIFEIDSSKLYNINYFNKLLVTKVKELGYIKINKNLKGKFLISYIYNKFMNTTDKTKLNKELFNIALIFPKDFLSAMYLIAISEKYNILLKADSFYDEILKSLKIK